MKPAPFEYFAPRTLDEAVDLMARYGWDAKLLAGGQSLVPTMNFRLAQPTVLVDLNRIGELAYVRGGTGGEHGGRNRNGSGSANGRPGDARARNGADHVAVGSTAPSFLHIGAMTRQAALERSAEVAVQAPLLAAALPFIAHPQIRSRGTIGGSIAHADPAAELPAVAVALGAELVIRNNDGERRVAASDFFQGLFTTALGPEDLLTEIIIPPMPAGTGWSFQEVARRHGDYALVGVAATVRFASGASPNRAAANREPSEEETGGGSIAGEPAAGMPPTGESAGDWTADHVCEEARLVFLSVGGGPMVASRACEALAGQPLDDARIADAARLAAGEEIDPVSDIHASAAYRRHLAEVLARRALMEARSRAGNGAVD